MDKQKCRAKSLKQLAAVRRTCFIVRSSISGTMNTTKKSNASVNKTQKKKKTTNNFLDGLAGQEKTGRKEFAAILSVYQLLMHRMQRASCGS